MVGQDTRAPQNPARSITQSMRRSSGEIEPAQFWPQELCNYVQPNRELVYLSVNVALKADLPMWNLNDGLWLLIR